MGADFIFALCRLEVDKDTAMTRLNLLTPKDIARLWDDDLDQDERDYKEEAENAIETVFASRRDTGELHIKGSIYAITGGMSWGDDPTDSFADICKVDMLGVTLPEIEWQDWISNCVTN